MNRACSFHTSKERGTADPDDLRFAKALSCAASVVKANRAQCRAATSRVYERKVFLWLNCMFGKMILSHLKIASFLVRAKTKKRLVHTVCACV